MACAALRARSYWPVRRKILALRTIAVPDWNCKFECPAVCICGIPEVADGFKTEPGAIDGGACVGFCRRNLPASVDLGYRVVLRYARCREQKNADRDCAHKASDRLLIILHADLPRLPNQLWRATDRLKARLRSPRCSPESPSTPTLWEGALASEDADYRFSRGQPRRQWHVA